jgi:enolase
MPVISSINCSKIVNSRGEWTIKTEVYLDDGSVGVQTVPDGASKGENEAVYVSADQAVENVSNKLRGVLQGIDPSDQKKLDAKMMEVDGTANKSSLGGNSILSVSLAAAKASAVSQKIPLYKYLANLYGNDRLSLPTPIFNILNGGKHAHNNLSFQEFMVIPSLAVPYDQALEMGVRIYHRLKENLVKDGFSANVGDEGGFAPRGFTVSKAMAYVKQAAKELYKVGDEVFFGMDVAAESFYKNKRYCIKEEKLQMSSEELTRYYGEILKNYEVIYLEDPFYEKDLSGWAEFSKSFSDKLMIVADDLVVTNPQFLKTAIDSQLANAVIVKPNQVGTLSETLEFIRMAKEAEMNIIVSHRSGDTAEDTFISDLAVGVGAEFIKSGAPARGERVVKYNRLLEIFRALQV